MCRIIDNPRTNESGSSIPFGLTLSRKRPAPPNRTKRQLHSVWAHAVTKTPCPTEPHRHTEKATLVRAQTEPLTRQ